MNLRFGVVITTVNPPISPGGLIFSTFFDTPRHTASHSVNAAKKLPTKFDARVACVVGGSKDASVCRVFSHPSSSLPSLSFIAIESILDGGRERTGTAAFCLNRHRRLLSGQSRPRICVTADVG